ncbi:MAG: transglycosylase domain-containing protein [Candidatus Pacebacteria bacterium]|nr:transglycosylase domain-containing protein [Candidatus Paceibacterota bacterium]
MEINLTAMADKIRLFKRQLLRKIRIYSIRISNSRSRGGRLSPVQQELLRVKRMKLLAQLSVVAVVVGIISFIGLFIWYSKDLPKPGEVIRRDGFSTKIFDREGQLLYDLYDTERRNPITLDQLPETLKQATVAIEDKDFYKHSGFDFLTVVRIPYNMVFRQRVVGGSTLTQQLVKNALLTNERTLSRKFKELVLSIQIERTFTKDQILEMYLNEAPYGGTAWGVGTAAELYFSKPVSELSLIESAFLAGLPQRPSVYSPFSGKKDADGIPYWKIRTESVLRAMEKNGYITKLQMEESIAGLDSLAFNSTDTDIKAPHFVFYVRDQLEEMFGIDLVEKGGLKVTTTLNLKLHDQAQNIVAEEVESVETYNITNGATVVMDPRTGEILSMVGSKDFFDKDIDGQFNVAADGLRQPGSSIKPITYLSLFRRGYSPATMLADVETVFKPNESADEYKPKNYDGQFRGPVSLRNSLGSSLNIPAVKGVAIVGVKEFLQTAYDLGFNTLEPTDDNMKRFGLAVTLGGAEVHLLDTVTAYSAFANGGLKVEPVSILKVEDKDGKTIYEHKSVAGPRVISEGEAFLINDVLSDNNARLLAFGPNSLLNTGRAIAVKTGTTNDQRDNWTIGWSQEVIVGTWVGNNDNSPMTKVASGVTGASPIWRRVIFAALDMGYGTPAWVMPADVEQVEVDAISGYRAHDEFPSRTDYFLKGTVPVLPDPIHAKLKVCNGDEGKLATEAKISAGDFKEREFIILKESDPFSQDGVNRWQDGINAWVGGQDDSRYKVPTEYCGDTNEVFVKITKPENEKSYDDTNIEVHIDAGSDAGIDRIEIYLDGEKKEVINDRKYRGWLNFPTGKHELYAKAFSRDGKEAKSNVIKLGSGGADWKDPEPTPTPSPTPVPTVIPSPTIIIPLVTP